MCAIIILYSCLFYHGRLRCIWICDAEKISADHSRIQSLFSVCDEPMIYYPVLIPIPMGIQDVLSDT